MAARRPRCAQQFKNQGEFMTTGINIHRRTFLGGVAALGAMHGFGISAQAAVSPSVANLPARGHVVIRNAYVMTMEPGQADLTNGDVHVDNGVILEVGNDLAAPGAEVIDGRGFIVMPGLIDTHWHMWTTLLRNMSGDDRAHGYFPMTTALGKVYTPRDMYYGTLLSAAEALHSGITTAHNWCHNIVSHEHAVEDLRAMQETGLRGRFSYGPARATPLTQPLNVADLARMQGDWASLSNEGLLTLGLAWRGVQAALPNAEGKMEIRPLSPDMYRVEYEAARKLNLPVSVHLNSNKFDSGHILALQKLGYVFDGLQVIHAINSSGEEMDMLAAAGASVSISPASELRIGFGLTKIGEFLDHKVNLALSVDTTPLTGNADMFGIMKLAQNLENGRSENEFKLPARRVLELATIEGAKALGLADRTGSLKKGKRADIIMVGTNGINIGPFTEPAYMLVDSAQAHNVDTVLVDGRILKRDGRLTAIHAGRLMEEASAASLAIRQRANWK
jgi:cytosine/adenosine deaminase-related metal-dependent hydrolase